MTHRTTLKHLEMLVGRINNLTGMPPAPYRKERHWSGDKHKPNAGCYFIDINYGGVNLACMSETEGCTGQSAPLGLGVCTKRELGDQLRAFIMGLEAS